MNRSGAVPVVIALLSISALGVAATTLETTLTTDPDDEINPDWDRLPIGQSDAASIEEEMGGASDGGEDEESGSSGGSEADSVGQAGESARSETREGTGSGFGVDTTAGESTLLDRLLALLAALLRILVPLLVVVAFGTLVYRYRGALLSLFGFESSEEPPEGTVPEGDDWPGADPSNVVDRAWLALVRRVNPESPETTTAAECRALARGRGLDSTAVEAISTAFERVHYGDVPVTEEADRARMGLRRLEPEGGTE